jgi:hypothetical protein
MFHWRHLYSASHVQTMAAIIKYILLLSHNKPNLVLHTYICAIQTYVPVSITSVHICIHTSFNIHFIICVTH